MNVVCNSCSIALPPWSRYCNACGARIQHSGAGASRNGGEFPTGLRETLQRATAGEYEIHDELGRGGMATVYLARDLGLDRLVAIKVMPPNLMIDAGLVERFKREARTAAKLSHPNIVEVYRVHRSQEIAFFAMRFVPGRTLGEILKEEPSLPAADVQRILKEAAAGLDYAHRRGVIHRDIKPANILIDGEGHVHLTDFGIAKALAGNTPLTEVGTLIGTPQYMAPEQCQGRPVDGRADQYSLAVVGYQMLVGHPPFEMDSMQELFYHHMFTPPKPLDAIRADTPGALRDTIHKALSKNPLDRFDTMKDFQAALEGKGPPVVVTWLEEARSGCAASVEGVPELPPTRPMPGPQAVQGAATASWPRWLRQTPAGRLVAGVVLLAAGAVVALLALTRDSGSQGPALGSQAGMAWELASSPATAESFDGEASPDPARPALEPPAVALASSAGAATPGERAGAGQPVAATDGHGDPGDGGRDPGAVEVSLERRAGLELAAGQATVHMEEIQLVPEDVLQELRTWMDEGRVLAEVGRFLEAAEAFQEVMRRAAEVSERYGDVEVLQGFQSRADSALREAQLACVLKRALICP